MPKDQTDPDYKKNMEYLVKYLYEKSLVESKNFTTDLERAYSEISEKLDLEKELEPLENPREIIIMCQTHIERALENLISKFLFAGVMITYEKDTDDTENLLEQFGTDDKYNTAFFKKIAKELSFESKIKLLGEIFPPLKKEQISFYHQLKNIQTARNLAGHDFDIRNTNYKGKPIIEPEVLEEFKKDAVMVFNFIYCLWAIAPLLKQLRVNKMERTA